MSRKLPARLRLEPARFKAGVLTHASVWVIRDGNLKRATGCSPDDTEGAARALADYVASKHAEKSQEPERDLAARQIPIADTLSFYATEASSVVKRPEEMLARIGRLLDWWGDRTLADVTKRNCADYVTSRSTSHAARRELEDLRAAIKLSMSEGHCRELVTVTLPPKAEGRVDYFTRDQIAALIWYCWRFRETQTIHRGPRKGQTVTTKRRPLRHVCRFILAAVYTGSRSARIWQASFEKQPGRPFVDLDTGIFYRKWQGERASRKRAGTIRIPERLQAHMLRWRDGVMVNGQRVPARYLVEHRGQAADPKKALSKAMDAVFGENHPYVRHTFRHTAITWLLWAGVEPADICAYASVSREMLETVYGHHHPEAHGSVGRAFSEGRAGHRKDRKVGKTIRQKPHLRLVS